MPNVASHLTAVCEDACHGAHPVDPQAFEKRSGNDRQRRARIRQRRDLSRPRAGARIRDRDLDMNFSHTDRTTPPVAGSMPRFGYTLSFNHGVDGLL